jgi:sigma-B regulation protein RsbU (phosphoserine phosphatase)
MVDLYSTLTSLFLLLGTASFMIVLAFTCASFSFSKFVAARTGIMAKIIIGVLLGLLAIYGTLMGTKLPNGTIVNVRELAVMIAGVTGGPLTGLLAGLIGGLHRYTVGGATALPCTISTILIGIASGFVSTRMLGKTYLLKGAALGLILESAAMGLILLLVQPFETAVNIVSQIAVPMIAANTIGLVLWMYLFNRFNLLH